MELTGRRASEKPRWAEISGLLLMVFALLSAVSLLSYRATDSSWFHHPSGSGTRSNWIGWFGSTLAESSLQVLGAAAFLLPLLLGYLGWQRFRHARGVGDKLPVLGLLLLGLALCALLTLLYEQIAYGGERRFLAGGYLGSWTAEALRTIFGNFGAMLVSTTALVCSVVVLTGASLLRGVELLVHVSGSGSVHLKDRLRDLARSVGEAYRRGRQRTAEAETRQATDLEPPTPEPRAVAARPSTEPPAPPKPKTEPSVPIRPEPPAAPEPAVAKEPAAPSRRPRQRRLPIDPTPEPGEFTLPPLDLLNDPQPQPSESKAELQERARNITMKLQEFSVRGEIVAIHPGPVVTTFEFSPEAGIKYSKITGMTDDLSLALRAESVRIDRLAGKSTVGIEVPNRHQETIYPKELLASDTFQDSASKLTLVLGKDISGNVCVAELERMPHLLIAGATGAGKSVGLNGMIASILFKATPDQVRFVMIDTKRIELGLYAEIPHLLIPVVTDPKQASMALKWAVREMELRYKKLAAVGLRNIGQFNELVEKDPERTLVDPKSGEEEPIEQLPYIVIVIDELADLLMIAASDVEESIMRLAQMARAVGIHLIIATQRPSVDVITGTIKANFPSRVAFRVSQRVDSRTIIDQQGAEHLLGRGDMLFLSNGSTRLRRVHGGYITEAELDRICSFLKQTATPIYNDDVLHDPEQDPENFEPEEQDEMYTKAVRTVVQEGKCSITLIQRRLQLGYARAARIVDMMERQGVVSPGEGSKPREILISRDSLEELEPQG